MKRHRHVSEALDTYASQLRQCLARALERAQGSKKMKAIDWLALNYAMYFLDCSKLPALSAIAQAKRLVTESVVRVLRPQLFVDDGLEALLDRIVSETTSQDVEEAVKELASLHSARDMIAAAAEEDREMDGETSDDDDAERGGGVPSVAALLAVGSSALYWERCERYITAVSLQTVSFRRYALLPHHDRELQEALESTSRHDLPAVVADLHALSACPESPGVDPNYYTVCYSRANFLLGQQLMREFAAENKCAAPVLSAEQLLRQREAAELAEQRRLQFGSKEDDAQGTAVDFLPDDAYLAKVLEQENDTLEQDEDFNKDEIADYYLRHAAPVTVRVGGLPPPPPPQTTVRVGPAPGRGGHQPGGRTHISVNESGSETNLVSGLIKPHRYCKVKTGYSWSQYNKTHYDSKSNPPPKQVLWYEFVLFYPALAKTKRNLDSMFRVENTEKGNEDDYCIIVFSAGPPYADVAYRIVRKQWDRRPGGVRASFNDQGRFRLFFRFTGTSYRR
jgi:hypothetical protein